MASLTTLLHTALRRIVKPLSRHDASNLCISHRNPYNNVTLSRLYHRIHFLDLDTKVYPQHKRLFDENHSTAIHDLSKFARTMKSSESLPPLVSEASFQWGSSIDPVTMPEVLRILRLIGGSLQMLHYAPAEWDTDIHKLYQVSSVNMPYPASSAKDISTEEVYSLFSVPTLHQITLHHCNNLVKDRSGANNLFDSVPWPDQSKARTSNVEYLSIQDTSIIEYDDLEQIMVWPKGLKAFECKLGTGTEEEEAWDCLPDPSTLINILKHQRTSLEQLSVDFNDRITAVGTFGTSLREYPALKRISMPRYFLVSMESDSLYVTGTDIFKHLNWAFKGLHLALPPALEELVLNVDKDVEGACWDKPLRPQFRRWVRDVLTHKQELYPSLRRVALWDNYKTLTPEEAAAWEKRVLEFLGVSSNFEDAGIQFSYKVSDVAPSFDDDYLDVARRVTS